MRFMTLQHCSQASCRVGPFGSRVPGGTCSPFGKWPTRPQVSWLTPKRATL